MINKEEHDKTINGLLEAAEVAKRKLLEYLQKKNINEIIVDIDNMDDNELKSLNEWALKGEFYEVCQAIKKLKDSR